MEEKDKDRFEFNLDDLVVFSIGWKSIASLMIGGGLIAIVVAIVRSIPH